LPLPSCSQLGEDPPYFLIKQKFKERKEFLDSEL